MKPFLSERLTNLQVLLNERGYDAMVVTSRSNSFYLTDFRASFLLLIIDKKGAVAITDPRYGEVAEKSLVGFELLVRPNGEIPSALADLWKRRGYKRVAVEGSLTLDEFAAMKKWTKGAKLAPDSSLLPLLRMTKDGEELRRQRKAIRLADDVMIHAFSLLEPGVTELEVARQIRRLAEENGGEGESFDCIVASGPNSSRPHHHPTTRKLKVGDAVTLDLGVKVGGYCSDITRTVVLGRVPKGFAEIYGTVLQAQLAAIHVAVDGALTTDVDAAARDIIKDAGYGNYFGHGTGHGVGIDIHEPPRLGPSAAGTVLPPDTLVTIEPGIYLPGKYGCRIEDIIQITTGKPRVLSTVPKDLLILS